MRKRKIGRETFSRSLSLFIRINHLRLSRKQPPVSRLILKELGIESGSKVPNRDKVGKLTKSQVSKIAKSKVQDMRIVSEEAAMMMVMGTARSMGVDIVEG